MAYNPTFAMLSSVKPLFFNGLKMSYASRTTREYKTPESNKSEGKNYDADVKKLLPTLDIGSHINAKYPSLHGTSGSAQREWTQSGDGILVSLIFDHVPAEGEPIFDDEPFILYNEEYDEYADENLIN